MIYKKGAEKDENEQLPQKKNDIIDMGKKAARAVALGGMALRDIFSSMVDNTVAQEKDKFAREIASLRNSGKKETVNAIIKYKNFFPIIEEFANVYEMAEEAGDNINDETFRAVISLVKDILLALYNQILENKDISPEDEEEYTSYINWLRFWALMFCDGDQFREAYPNELFDEMPERWDAIIELLDEIFEAVCEDSFSDVISQFADTVVGNIAKMLDLLSSSDWDKKYFESICEIVEKNNQAVKILEKGLFNALAYLDAFLLSDEA